MRDESDRQGMRIVVDVKKGEPAQVILNNLYKHTPLQDTFGVIFLAIVDQRPRVLTLLDACELFIDFRREVVRRRTAFELRKAEARAHILEGYVIALDNLDEVIALIRAAASPDEAHAGLIARFGLTELQADAILELQLQRLTGLERQKIVDELAELQVRIADLQGDPRLAPAHRRRSSRRELAELRKTHADPRRTEIVAAANEITIEDLIADEDVAISITHTGYIKRTLDHELPRAAARRPRQGRACGRRRRTSSSDLFVASTHSYILIFTNRGRIYWLKVHEIPDVGPQGKGKAVVNLVQMQPGEKIAAFCAVRDFEAGGYILLATAQGHRQEDRAPGASRTRARRASSPSRSRRATR